MAHTSRWREEDLPNGGSRAMSRFDATMREVLKVAKEMYEARLSPLTYGNVSARIPGTNLVAITPTSLPYETMELEDIVIVDLDGNVIEGRYKPSSETPLHTMVYRARNDVGGIVHTHSTFATAFAVARKEIPVICMEGRKCGGVIHVTRPAKAGTPELGEAVLEALSGENKVCCLIANHGLLTTGPDVNNAFTVAIAAEDIAKVYYLALQIGIPAGM